MTMRLILLAVLPAVRAGEYDSCGRPDAVFASWDQVDSLRHAPPRSLHRRSATATTLPADCTMPRGQGNGRSYAYGAIEGGDNIYILGRACASPSHT